MKISIIIPFQKGLSYLEDCLQSIKEQSYRDFEVILVCDHTDEKLNDIMNTYQPEYQITIYSLKESTGVAAARNYGMSKARGEYIYFLDSDDYLDYNTLELFASALDYEPYDIVYGKIKHTWFGRSTFLANQVHISEQFGEQEEVCADTSEAEQNPNEIQDSDSIENEFPNYRMKAYKQLISSKKGIKNISILHILIKRSLLTAPMLQFHEELIYFSDYPLLFQVLLHADSFHYQKNAVYIKRKHNDPINHPSLSQRYRSQDFIEFVQAYHLTIALPEITSELRNILDRKLLNYYSSSYAPKLHRSKNLTELRPQFDIIHLLVQDMDRELLKKYRGYKGRLFKALINGNFKKSISIVTFHLAYRKIKKIVRSKKELAKALYLHVFLKSSMKNNWVICESFFGKNYSDNPKYIYEYLSKNYPNQYRFIWVIDKKETKIPYKHKRVKRFSLQYFYFLARCKYFIFNGRQPEWARKREGNIFLQTWHGTPLKRLAFDIEEINSATARYKKQLYNQSRAWDYLIAPNQYSSDIFRRCFMYEKDMLETGYPRNDILHYKNKDKYAENIKKRLGIPLDKKTILYAPTWRDDEFYEKGKYKFSLQLDLELLRDKLQEDYVILLRTHYFIADNLDLSGMDSFVYNLSKYDDIAELYLISDLLITDYSSVFFDYANLKRPMLFFMYDLDKYRDVLRGFYIDIEEELPGPMLFTTQEILHAIEKLPFLTQEYEDKYARFYHKYCSWEDGNASKRTAERVFQLSQKTS